MSPTSTGADNVRHLIKGIPVRDAPSFYYAYSVADRPVDGHCW